MTSGLCKIYARVARRTLASLVFCVNLVFGGFGGPSECQEPRSAAAALLLPLLLPDVKQVRAIIKCENGDVFETNVKIVRFIGDR